MITTNVRARVIISYHSDHDSVGLSSEGYARLLTPFIKSETNGSRLFSVRQDVLKFFATMCVCLKKKKRAIAKILNDRKLNPR
jgi:hypothetical protein